MAQSNLVRRNSRVTVDQLLRDAFNRIDVNKDGKVDALDIQKGLHLAGVRLTTEQVGSLMGKLDPKNQGHVSFEDFQEIHDAFIAKTFKTFDKDGKGYLDDATIQDAMQTLGVSITVEEAHAMIQELNPVESHRVQENDFKYLYLYLRARMHTSTLEHFLWDPDVRQLSKHWWKSSVEIGEGGLRAPIPEPKADDSKKSSKVTPTQRFFGGALSGVIEALILTPLDVTKTRLQLDKTGQYKGMLDCGKKLFRAEGPKKSSKVTPTQRFFGGALSGVIEALILTPLDVTKTRLQLDKTGQYKGMLDCGKKLFRAEGPLGLYKGFTPWTIHVVTKNGTRFYFNAIYRKLLADKNGQVSGTKEFVAGALAGATEAVLIVTPFEVIKTRMQGQNIVKGEVAKYGGPIQTTLTIIKNEGPLALWKGVAPTIGRQGLNQACSFWSNNAIKKHLWKLQDGESLPAWKSGLTGMLGAIPGPCINCPMDVVKTRLMAQETVAGQAPKYTGMVQAMRVIAAEEGFSALYKGLVPRLTRLCPSYGIQWLVMDQVTAYFAKQNN